MLNIKLNQALEKRLEYLCQKTGHTKDYYLKKALYEFLDDLDDKEDYALGTSILKQKETRISLKELEKELGLDS